MEKKVSVCVVIVTYNRKEYLRKTLEGLEKQTYPVSAILIYDNHSFDGTREMLQNMGVLNTEVESNSVISNIKGVDWIYHRSSVNSGGSGGFHEGVKIAYQMKYDYLWMMDDDVFPEQNCLEELLQHMSKDTRLCIPSRTDSHFNDKAIVKINMRNPFRYALRHIKTYVPSNEIKGDVIPVVDMPFEGPLVSTALISEIGFPNKNMFLNYDDTEYALRASKKTKILYCKNAILHKQIVPMRDKDRLMDWKDYYSYRNQIWFYRTYGENFGVRTLRPLLLILDLCGRAVIRKKWSNIIVIRRAYQDGVKGNLGKQINPGTPVENF